MSLFTDAENRDLVKALGGGEQAAYVPSTGSSTVVYVDFRNEYEATQLFGVEIESSKPLAFVATVDLAGTEPRNGTLTVGGVTYTILTPRPDGTGMTMLDLEEQ